jgi:acyl-coenzyme A synthetase/AMP-(fatty) acid ligase/acyl carrier protein
VPHRAINRLVINTNYVQLTTDDVVAQVSNAAFDAATWEIWGALLNGARLVVVPKETVLSPPELAARLKEHGVSAIFLTTALFNQVAREDPKAFSSLHHVLVGGEAVEPRWVREVMAEGGPERLLNAYGPTETTTFAIWYHVQEVEEGATTIPIGRPIANTEAYVLDAKMQPVPIGVPGELYIGGPGLARGYLRRPELTAEKFVANPFSDEVGARLYKTGDLVRYLADGNLVYLGRIDHQVKLRGYRIELGEIESTLRRHAGVRESVVVLREDAPEQKRLAAYVVAAGPSRPSARELRAFLRKMLPDYMVPSAFVVLDKLPLTPNGKVDRRALPAPERPHLEEGFVAPRTPVEEALAEIWAEVLRLKQVGIHSDFFELGGHSLLATLVISRVREVFQAELPLRSMFEELTVAGLAERVEVARQSNPVPSLAAPGSDDHEEVRL